MTKSGMFSTIHRVLLCGLVLTSVLLLGGCAVEVENREAAQEAARLAKPPGSVYTGWRVFQDRCAYCHGPDASGTVRGTDLLPRIREMGLRQFVGVVLKRYGWNLPALPTGTEGAALEVMIESALQRQGPVLSMPEWQGEPRVSAHMADLSAYLAARADGRQGPDRPLP